jgi:hypothetical protein
VAHSIAVISNELQQVEALITGLHLKVELPCIARVTIHDVAACQPTYKGVLLLVLLVLHKQQRFLQPVVVHSSDSGTSI